MPGLEILAEHRCFGGTQRTYRHDSAAIGLPMKFSVFTPGGLTAPAPALFYLAGLTCTEDTFMTKAGAQRVAAELGLILVAPDTSPRGAGIPGEDESWDFGTGAGFYLDATLEPWRSRYRMYSYLVDELYGIATEELLADPRATGIFGHSMGGHGALVLALRNPDKFRSVSAFAPVAAPARSPWGQKAFGAYLGPDRAAWARYDATELMAAGPRTPFAKGILIDQGLADAFLAEQLYPDAFEAACAAAGQPLTLRRQEGYDHGYYFISSFMEDHLRFHAERLRT
jgi:S-formylglutathione hydrolase